jgi:gas vesicle protein
MSNADGGSQFIKGLVFGGLIGSIVALLYAPKSGKEMREAIKQGSREFVHDAETKVDSVQNKIDQLLADTKNQMEELLKEAASAVDELKSYAGKKYDESKTAFAKEKTRIKSAIDNGASAYKDEKNKKSKKA